MKLSALATFGLASAALPLLAAPTPPLSPPAAAADDGLAGYKHSHWTGEEGAPIRITAVAQARNGLLWLATGVGLYRFDGINFEQIAPPDGVDAHSRATAVLVVRSGDVWVGYQSGKLAVYHAGQLRLVDGVEASMINKMAQDTTGAVWVSNSQTPTMGKYVDGHRQEVGANFGFEPQIVSDVFATRSGELWIAGWKSLQRLRSGSRRLETIETNKNVNRSFSEDDAARLWVFEPGGLRLISERGRILPKAEGTYSGYVPQNHHRTPRLLMDHDGDAWLSLQEGGLIHLHPGMRDGKRQIISQATFAHADGLTSDSVWTLLQGREGEIWAGTAAGLDRFRPAAIVSASSAPTLTTQAWSDKSGSVFLMSREQVFRKNRLDTYKLLADKLGYVLNACQGNDGTHWILAANTWLRWNTGDIQHIPLPNGWTAPPFGCAVAGDGHPWVTAYAVGLYRADTLAHWSPISLPGVEWRTAMPTLIAADKTGRMVLPLIGKGLLRTDGTHVQWLWQGEPIGRVLSINTTANGIWLGGSDGIGLADQGVARWLSSRQYPWLAGVQAVTASGNDIWIANARSVIRADRGDLLRALGAHAGAIRHASFDALDGLPGPPSERAQTGLVVDRDGSIWIATENGLAKLDPKRITRNQLPPPVDVVTVIADGKRYSDPTNLDLQAGTSRLEFHFTAGSLFMPERVRFRYKLEGVDPDWVESGNRREAFYTNIGPGHYRFRVIAANDAGVWNRQGAEIGMEVAPTFIQSNWFKALVGLALVLLGWVAYRLRVGQVTGKLRVRMEERLAERERIARELHDTLLQGFQALVLRFQAVADRFPVANEARPILEQALVRADAVLVEGRDRVQFLRVAQPDRDVANVFRRVAADAKSFGCEAKVAVDVTGEPRDLAPMVRDEVMAIGEEALRNACSHARASRIDVTMDYAVNEFRLTIVDDGIGIPEMVAKQGGRANHFGLLGMRERAHKIGAVITIAGEQQGGTLVSLTVAGKIAYPAKRAFWNGPWRPARAASSPTISA